MTDVPGLSYTRRSATPLDTSNPTGRNYPENGGSPHKPSRRGMLSCGRGPRHATHCHVSDNGVSLASMVICGFRSRCGVLTRCWSRQLTDRPPPTESRNCGKHMLRLAQPATRSGACPSLHLQPPESGTGGGSGCRWLLRDQQSTGSPWGEKTRSLLPIRFWIVSGPARARWSSKAKQTSANTSVWRALTGMAAERGYRVFACQAEQAEARISLTFSKTAGMMTRVDAGGR
jgi:hypothetical protein